MDQQNPLEEIDKEECTTLKMTLDSFSEDYKMLLLMEQFIPLPIRHVMNYYSRKRSQNSMQSKISVGENEPPSEHTKAQYQHKPHFGLGMSFSLAVWRSLFSLFQFTYLSLVVVFYHRPFSTVLVSSLDQVFLALLL